MVDRQGDTTTGRVFFGTAIMAVALLWLLPGTAKAGGTESSGTGFISAVTAQIGQARDGSGRVAVRVIDAEGQDVTAAVRRRDYLGWSLERDGKAVDGAGYLRPGAYSLRLRYGDSELRSPVNVAPGNLTTVTIRPGVVRVVPGQPHRAQDPATLIFTAAPDEISEGTFARRGCAVVGANIAMIRKFPAAGPGGEIFLPPGLYRMITEYGRQTMNTIWVRLRPGRAVSLMLGETGAHGNHVARAPVFAGKCYF